MPKMKTHRGVAKRFKVSATGKILRKKAGKSHLLTKKSRRIKRHLKDTETLNQTDAGLIRRLMPYGSKIKKKGVLHAARKRWTEDKTTP
jgi:large subunit ribosomal protein L35